MNSSTLPEFLSSPIPISRQPSCLGLRAFTGARDNERVRLVCLPWCGAGASVYRRFLPYLPEDVSLHAAQLPGREDCFSRPRLRRMAEVVHYLLPETAALCRDPRIPLVLFGHSMGAIVAFELTRALAQHHGVQPALLIVSGHASPSVPRRNSVQWHAADDAGLIRNIRELGGTPDAVLRDESMMRTLLPLIKADYEVLETYTSNANGMEIDCPLIACAGHEDREVTPDTLGAWATLTRSCATTHWFEGSHFYLHERPAQLVSGLLSWMRDLSCAHVTFRFGG